MSAAFYTSYETSLALREAGAPQGRDVPLSLWTTYGGIAKPMLTRAAYVPEMGVGEARAFRLDEILAALAALGDVALDNHREADPSMRWSVRHAIDCNSEVGYSSGPGPSPVEAAAACYLAVLRAAREARP